MRIDDAILSGSVIGSAATVSLTGSFTGSGHVATASFLLGTVESASYALTSSHAITASYALNSVGFSSAIETSNFNFVIDTFHIISASAITGTLPATPTSGQRVAVSNLGSASPLIARNGNNIMDLAQDFTIDSDNASFQLVYSDTTSGWVILGANN